jgi:hypothetical protein
MGTVTRLKARPRPPAKELPERLIEDADRPEHRYLGTPLLELLTSGALPKAALKINPKRNILVLRLRPGNTLSEEVLPLGKRVSRVFRAFGFGRGWLAR